MNLNQCLLLRELPFRPIASRVIDRELDIDNNLENRKSIENLPEEKRVFLKKIGSLLDIYDGKIYHKESDLQEDVNSFLAKTDFFWWRQNSGKVLFLSFYIVLKINTKNTGGNTLYMSVLPIGFCKLNRSMCVAKPNIYNHSLGVML